MKPLLPKDYARCSNANCALGGVCVRRIDKDNGPIRRDFPGGEECTGFIKADKEEEAMGFLKGLLSLPVAVVADVATLGGSCIARKQSFTKDAVDHLTGNDPESRFDRVLSRAERVAKIREQRVWDDEDGL